MFLYIHNKDFLLKITSLLDDLNINYTTNEKEEYEYILIAELNKKTISLVTKTTKKIIFITYLIENKIVTNNKRYLDRLLFVLNKCFKIIVSLPSIKNIIKLENIIIIPKPILDYDIYQKFNISKRKKKILIIDYSCNHLDKIKSLIEYYPKYQYIYLNKNFRKKEEIHNIIFIKYIDQNKYEELIKMSFLVINFEKNMDIKYLYPIILLKKQLLMIENKLYDDYLINSKNIYIFKYKNEMILKFKKILEHRIANLTDNAYILIKENSYQNVINKIKIVRNKM